jgi:lysine 2,3-aminomutase
MSPDQLEAAYAYIESHPEIWEVILTGGDPLILKPAMIKKILERLSTIEHVEVIRIHTRVPVVDSSRITSEMIAALQLSKPVYVVLHANHPDEFTPEAVAACAALVDAGIPMLSQSTLLKDVNDNIDVLSKLMRCFIRNRIKPYYLHQGDLVRGSAHFRTTIEKGQMLMKQLRGRFSGICQPVYVLDIPGGYGKMPIGPNYLSKNCSAADSYCIEDYQGEVHTYSPAGTT